MQVILRILYTSPEVHTGSLFSTSLSALHNNNKSPLLCECKDFIELLLVKEPYKTASLLSRLYGTRICLETDANSIAKEILKKVQGRRQSFILDKSALGQQGSLHHYNIPYSCRGKLSSALLDSSIVILLGFLQCHMTAKSQPHQLCKHSTRQGRP